MSHNTLESMDFLSDHLPIKFLMKLNSIANNVPINYDQTLWNKIKYQNKEDKFSNAITQEFDKLLEDNDFNAGSVNEKI